MFRSVANFFKSDCLTEPEQTEREQNATLESQPVTMSGALRDLDGKQLAVILSSDSGTQVLRGRGRYRELAFASDLRIEVENDDSDLRTGMAVIIREDEWDGEIIPDRQYGCDYQIRVPS